MQAVVDSRVKPSLELVKCVALILCCSNQPTSQIGIRKNVYQVQDSAAQRGYAAGPERVRYQRFRTGGRHVRWCCRRHSNGVPISERFVDMMLKQRTDLGREASAESAQGDS